MRGYLRPARSPLLQGRFRGVSPSGDVHSGSHANIGGIRIPRISLPAYRYEEMLRASFRPGTVRPDNRRWSSARTVARWAANDLHFFSSRRKPPGYKGLRRVLKEVGERMTVPPFALAVRSGREPVTSSGFGPCTYFGPAFPAGTLTVNLVGLFAITLVLEWRTDNGNLAECPPLPHDRNSWRTYYVLQLQLRSPEGLDREGRLVRRQRTWPSRCWVPAGRFAGSGCCSPPYPGEGGGMEMHASLEAQVGRTLPCASKRGDSQSEGQNGARGALHRHAGATLERARGPVRKACTGGGGAAEPVGEKKSNHSRHQPG